VKGCFEAMSTLIITHTDMDGVASAALYLYLNKPTRHLVYFAEPYSLDIALGRNLGEEVGSLAIMDLGVNPVIFDRVKELLSRYVSRGVQVTWFDHHVWSDEWVESVEKLGVRVIIDRSTCATGVVYRYSRAVGGIDQDFVSNLVGGVCAGDLWRFDHWLAPFYIRLVRRRDSNEWRRKVMEVLSKGRYWDPLFDEKVVEAVEAELRSLRDDIRRIEKRVGGLKINVVESSDEVENSFIAAFLMGRFNADIAVVASSDGKLSFRSNGVNVRDIAVALGGGGHPTASGAKVDIPLSIRILSRFSRTIFLNYVASRIVEKASMLHRA